MSGAHDDNYPVNNSLLRLSIRTSFAHSSTNHFFGLTVSILLYQSQERYASQTHFVDLKDIRAMTLGPC